MNNTNNHTQNTVVFKHKKRILILLFEYLTIDWRAGCAAGVSSSLGTPHAAYLILKMMQYL